MTTKSPEKPLTLTVPPKPVKSETAVRAQEQVQSSLRRLAASQAKLQSVEL